MPTTIERFAGEHFTLNSISERRQGQVLAALARLELFLRKPAEQATDGELRGWLVALLDSGLAPSTVRLYLSSVLPFYHWCWRAGLISSDELARIRETEPPRGSGQSVPRPYSRKDLMRLWAQLDARYPLLPEPGRSPGKYVFERWRNGTSPFRSVRRHVMRVQLNAIIELALVCGLRKTEIYHLSLDDVHWDNRYIVVHGKRVNQNDKLREVPYPDSTRAAVREWYRLRGYMGATTDSVWLSVTGHEPTAALSWERMSKILVPIGDWQLHRLRHTCATERLRAGMPIEQLQRFLGHATVQQTLAYSQLVRSDVHRASERVDADFQRAIKRAA